MLTYLFDKTRSDYLYEQLYNFIRSDILSGILPPHSRLPSKRTLAEHNNISVITVENAYGQLAAEGYIYSKPKSGFYVSEIISARKEFSPSPRIKAEDRSLDYRSDIHRKESDLLPYIADFSSTEVDSSSFPFKTWMKLQKELFNSYPDIFLKKTPAHGALPLRQAIARHLSDFRGMDIDPEQIVIGAGTEYLYSLIARMFGQDKIFALEEPGYTKLSNIYESNGIDCVFSETHDLDRSLIRDLEKLKADIIHVSPSHHFPTGKVMPVSRRYELLGWANSHTGHYIIEDDYDSEFRFSGKPIPTLFSIDGGVKVIYLNTFSKSLTPTIRISYMILPEDLARLFHEKLSFLSCTVSNFEQYTLAEFINKGYFDKHLNRMKNIYRKKKDFLIDRIRRSDFFKNCEISGEESGLHFLVKVDTALSDIEIIKYFADRRIKLDCLSGFYKEKEESVDHTLIFNYAGSRADQIEKAFNNFDDK